MANIRAKYTEKRKKITDFQADQNIDSNQQ